MSDYKNIDDLIVLTETKLSEVPGVSVQKYGENAIVDALLEGFKFCARERWWPHLMLWQTRDLDGSTGVITADFNPVVLKNGDIRAVMPSDRNRQLPILPSTINPFLLASGRMLYTEEYHGSPDRLFRVWPLTATGTVNVHTRIIPADSALTDSGKLIPFNPDILANYAANSVSVDDGTNPGQQTRFLQTFTALLAQESMTLDSQPIILDPQQPNDPIDVWWVNPST